MINYGINMILKLYYFQFRDRQPSTVNRQPSTVNRQQIILKFVLNYVNKIKLRWRL